MEIPFKGPKLKICRAKHHIADLERTIIDYRTSRPFVLTIGDIKGRPLFNVIRQTPPENLPLILGDAIHNARTALDLLAGDLVEINNNNRENVRFPFPKKEDGFKKQMNDSKFKRAAPHAIQMVRDYKPWMGELRALHDLDIADKHSMIIPLFTFISGNNFSMIFGAETIGISMTVSSEPVPVDITKLENLLAASLKLVFPSTPINNINLQEIEVVLKLRQYVEFVSNLIQSFEEYYASQGLFDTPSVE